MNALKQKTISNFLSDSTEVESERAGGMTVVDNLEKVMTKSVRRSDEQESELEHVAVLAYD